MNKQEFLDQSPDTAMLWVTQQLLTNVSKTDVENIRRTLEKLLSTLYKSHAKTISIEIILSCVRMASNLNKYDQLEKPTISETE